MCYNLNVKFRLQKVNDLEVANIADRVEMSSIECVLTAAAAELCKGDPAAGTGVCVRVATVYYVHQQIQRPLLTRLVLVLI